MLTHTPGEIIFKVLERRKRNAMLHRQSTHQTPNENVGLAIRARVHNYDLWLDKRSNCRQVLQPEEVKWKSQLVRA